MERDFKGVWIPRTVYLDERLNALDKMILTEIDSLDKGPDGCWASNQHLADFCQCGLTKVSTSITKLIDLGYVEVISFDGRTRHLKSCLSKSERQTFKKRKADFQKVNASNTKEKPKERLVDDAEEAAPDPFDIHPDQGWVDMVGDYEANIGPLPYSEVAMANLRMQYEALGSEVMREAIRVTALKQPTNPHVYLRHVCQAWVAAGVTTLEQARAQSAEHDRQVEASRGARAAPKVNPALDYTQRTYTEDELSKILYDPAQDFS